MSDISDNNSNPSIPPELEAMLKQQFGDQGFLVVNPLEVVAALKARAISDGFFVLFSELLKLDQSAITKVIDLTAIKVEHQAKAHSDNPEIYKALPDMLMKIAFQIEENLNNPRPSRCGDTYSASNGTYSPSDN